MGDQIMEDLVETPPERSVTPPGKVLWLLVGVGVGVALAAVFGFFRGESNEPAEAGQPVLLPTGDLLPGFDAGFSAVVLVDGQGMDFIEWPSAAEGLPVSRQRLPFGDLGTGVLPQLDVSGHLAAVAVPLRDTIGSALYAGPVGSMRAVASAVSGFAWHDSASGELSWISHDFNGGVGLWTSQGGTNTPMHLATLGGVVDPELVAYGDWGFALEDGTQVFVVDQSGGILRAHPGAFQDSLPDGSLLVFRDGQPVVIASDGTEHSVQLGAEVDQVLEVLDGVGDWWSGAFVGEPGRVAILGSRGLALIAGGDIRIYQQDPARPGIFVGSGHLAYARAAGGAVIVDLGSGEEFEVLSNESVRALAFLNAAG